MWKKIAPLLIVLSIALNVAFISVWAVHAARAHWPRRGVADDTIWCPLHRRLNVTDEQWQRLEPRLEVFRARTQAVWVEIDRLRNELIDLIASADPDRDAIAAKQDEIRAGQERMQQLVVEHLLAEKEVLTAEQQDELFDLIRQRSACPGQGRMMGLPGSGPNAPQHSRRRPHDHDASTRGEQP